MFDPDAFLPPTVRLEPSQEFKDLWHSLKTPIGDELAQELQAGQCMGPFFLRMRPECMHPFPRLFSLSLSLSLARQLARHGHNDRTANQCSPSPSTAGLTASSAAPPPPTTNKKKVKGRKGPGSSNRRFKITNVHLKDQGIDLSKDYVPQGK